MNNRVKCHICLNADGGLCNMGVATLQDGMGSSFDCEICGKFIIPYQNNVQIYMMINKSTEAQRALISHRLCEAKLQEDTWRMITLDWLESVLKNTLPNPIEQKTNMIRYIGDEVSKSGKSIERLPVDFHAIIGALNRDSSIWLVNELEKRGILTIDGLVDSAGHSHYEFANINLSLEGWEQYETEKRGEFEGNYGFIAMKFNDTALDAFVQEVVKPAVKDGIGYDLVDMRDVAKAGVIDNIMRVRIRGSAFVIVDLTHDNSGAYWEAGYAEGLGKPVIYICEKEKFEKDGTHFDTNHCTTVRWSRDNDEGFKKELIATIRRSLNPNG